MARDRYVLLGLARARADWFRSVGRWATAGVIPAEFVRCVSAEELRARLVSGRPFSAVLVDGDLPAADRDLIGAARDAGCVVLAVDGGRGVEAWSELGVAAVLPPGFGREHLLDALATNARMIGAVDHIPEQPSDPARELIAPGRVVAVVGSGGTGVSSAAIALAQGLAGRQGDRSGRSVVLADLRRHAEQAMLHDTRDIVPGLQELVEAHRGRLPSREAVRQHTFDIETRGYRLLLGLRRPRYWVALRPRAFAAAFDSLRRCFGVIVCDVDRDLEGEDDGGSIDVEERNLPARTAISRAEVVLAVGVPGMKGIYSLVRVIEELLAHGVTPDRLVPVVNQAPRRPRLRAEASAAFAELTSGLPGGADLPEPVFLPRRKVAAALRDGVPVPAPLPERLVGAFGAAIERREPTTGVPLLDTEPAPARVRPGSLGMFHAREELEP